MSKQIANLHAVSAELQQPSLPLPRVLAVGPWQTAEFAQLRAELDPHGDWPAFATWTEAFDDADESGKQPDVVLCAQPRPGAVDHAAIDRVCLTWPLTRIVVVAGTWCEGELRTGQPPAGVVRLYWYEFAAWWRSAIARTSAGLTPPWAEPLFDVRAGQVAEQNGSLNKRGRLAIDSCDYAAFEALELGLREIGWDAVWQPRHRPEIGRGVMGLPSRFAAAIWDGSQLDEAESNCLRAFCSQMRERGAPVVALLDFPRGEHPQAARELGAAAVFAKPYQLALLHQELIRLR